jgi:hypothetical protein
MNRFASFEALALPIAVATLEAVWLGLWLTWLGRLPGLAVQAGGALLPVWVIGATVLGGHWLGRLAPSETRRQGDRSDLIRARRIVAAGGLAAVWLGMWTVYGDGHALWSPAWMGIYLRGLASNWDPVPAQALSLAVSVYLWRRGILAGQAVSQDVHDDLRYTFYKGVAGLALVLLLAARPRAAEGEARLLAEEVGAAVLVYFAVGLGALALASARRALRQSQQLGKTLPALNRYWIGAAAGVIALVLAGALAAGWLVTPEPIRAIFTALAPAVHFAAGALLFVFIMIAYVALIIAQALVPVLGALLMAISRMRLSLFAEAEPPSFDQLTQQVNRLIDSIPAGRLILNAAGVLILLAGIALVFWLALNRLGQRRASGVEETREGIASRALIGQQLGGLLRRLWPGGRQKLTPFVKLHGQPHEPRLIIRRAYQAMLAWASESLEQPREPAQTPGAYAERLSARLPQAGQALGILTAAYLKARYAPAAPTAAEAEQARQAAAYLGQLTGRRPGAAT